MTPLRESLERLVEEVIATDEHGDGHHDDACSLCVALAAATEALALSPHESQPPERIGLEERIGGLYLMDREQFYAAERELAAPPPPQGEALPEVEGHDFVNPSGNPWCCHFYDDGERRGFCGQPRSAHHPSTKETQ